MNIHITDVNFNFQFSQKLNGHNIHSPWMSDRYICILVGYTEGVIYGIYSTQSAAATNKNKNECDIIILIND